MYSKHVVSKNITKKGITLNNSVISLEMDGFNRKDRDAFISVHHLLFNKKLSFNTPAISIEYSLTDDKSTSNEEDFICGATSVAQGEYRKLAILRDDVTVGNILQGIGKYKGYYNLMLSGDYDSLGLVVKDVKYGVQIDSFGEVLKASVFSEDTNTVGDAVEDKVSDDEGKVAEIIFLPFGTREVGKYSAYALYYNNDYVSCKTMYLLVALFELLLADNKLYVRKDYNKCINYDFVVAHYGSGEKYNLINWVATVRSEILSKRYECASSFKKLLMRLKIINR